MRRIPLPIPPLAEQRRIVAALEDHLSRLDAGLSSVGNAELRLASLTTALASAATGALGNASVSTGRWEIRTVGDLAEVGTGATPARSRKDYYESGSIPWVTSGALNHPYVDSSAECITSKALAETSVKIWPVGTLLMAMYGEGKTRGKCSELRIEAATNQACAAIVLKPEWRDRKDWVKLVLTAAYENNRKLAAGGVQPNLNLGLVRSIQVPLPPIDEQQAILAEFQRQQSVVVSAVSALRAARQRAVQLRASLLAEAFAGRLVPQDPSDEPASELLARIRAEREATLPKQKTRSRRTQKELPAPPTRVTGGDYQQEALPL